jgi:hypothetical protein
MTIREQITDICAFANILVTPEDEITKSSPGVYLFSAYDKDIVRMRRYKGVDKGGVVSVECY